MSTVDVERVVTAGPALTTLSTSTVDMPLA